MGYRIAVVIIILLGLAIAIWLGVFNKPVVDTAIGLTPQVMDNLSPSEQAILSPLSGIAVVFIASIFIIVGIIVVGWIIYGSN